MSGKYSPGMLAMRQKLLDHAKQSANMGLKLLQKAIQETAGATGDLIGNKIAYKSTELSKYSKQNNYNKNSYK